jgi:hypothetical protein
MRSSLAVWVVILVNWLTQRWSSTYQIHKTYVMYDSHNNPNVIFLFFREWKWWRFTILPTKVNCSLLCKWLSHIVHNTENYCFCKSRYNLKNSYMLYALCTSVKWHSTTKNNCFYKVWKTLHVKGCYLIWRPSLFTSLYLSYVTHICQHTSWIVCCLSKSFRVTL